jgi:hypothetical protein
MFLRTRMGCQKQSFKNSLLVITLVVERKNISLGLTCKYEARAVDDSRPIMRQEKASRWEIKSTRKEKALKQ